MSLPGGNLRTVLLTQTGSNNCGKKHSKYWGTWLTDQVAFDMCLEGKTGPEASLSMGMKGISSRGSSDGQGKAWGW